MKKFSAIFLHAFMVVTALGSPFKYVVSYNHTNAVYNCKEDAVLIVEALETNGVRAVEGEVIVTIDNYGTNIINRLKYDLTKGNPFSIRAKLDEPGFMRVWLDSKDQRPEEHSVAFEPEKIRKGSSTPVDFDVFWADARMKLRREVPIDVNVKKAEERCTADFDYYWISFATFGRRVYGFMSVPTDKSKGPFPLQVSISGAGYGSWTTHMSGSGSFINVFFTVYPFEPHWDYVRNQQKYENFDRMMHEKYHVDHYQHAGISNSREEYFYYPVILGIDRAVDWLVMRPNVDRSRVVYTGGSQGGGLGIWLCALNRSFTKCSVTVPALTDILGERRGRKTGWPLLVENQPRELQPIAAKNAEYFDGATFASRIRCPFRVCAGFVDRSCSPNAVWAGYNEVAVLDKQMQNGIDMDHSPFKWVQEAQDRWLHDFPEVRGDGPALSAVEFLTAHIDVAIPELKNVSQLARAGKTAKAEHAFAEYVRKVLNPERFLAKEFATKPDARHIERLREQAADTIARKFTTVMTTHQYDPANIDWNLNPTCNNYEEYVWQLNRLEFLESLAAYYRETRDESASRAFVEILSSWWNGQKLPQDGTSAYATGGWRTIDAGIRMFTWPVYLHSFLRSNQLSDRFLVQFFRSVCEHNHRLIDQPTIGNWQIHQLSGILMSAVAFPFLKDAAKWEVYALEGLMAEFGKQVYPDGFQFELTTGYHWICINNIRTSLAAYERTGRVPPRNVVAGLERMYDVLAFLMRPDGSTPDLNDGGHIDVPKNLSAALRYFPDRKDFAFLSSRGKSGESPSFLSAKLPYSGAVTFRTGWWDDALWAYVDNSPFGCGHQHEDKLNFLLFGFGKELITEGGTYAYDASEMRRYVVSTRAHNTILVDGKGQCSNRTYKWDDSMLAHKASGMFGTSRSADFCRDEFADGYSDELASNEPLDLTRHERTVVFHKDVKGTSPFFAIIDRLVAPDLRERTWEMPWHLESKSCDLRERGFLADYGDGVKLVGVVSDTVATLVDMKGSEKPFQGWMPIFAAGEHEHRPINTPVFKGSFVGLKRIVTVLQPLRGDTIAIASVDVKSDPSDRTYAVTLADGSRLDFHEPK
ncbi:MAG: acetylxylan esterase [Kiritimatiellae bacterium]|nr:acetylxylan esterase [Kiritimatiellia bacterium]